MSDYARGAQEDRYSIHRLWQWIGKFAGQRLLVDLAYGETQEEHLRNLIFEEEAMSMTMEQVVTQPQQELFTLRAQVTAQSGLSQAVRAINNLGCSKEFNGREEDFQQWSKKTEAFFAGVIMKSEMMLEWAAEQPTEITTTAIELEFFPTEAEE